MPMPTAFHLFSLFSAFLRRTPTVQFSSVISRSRPALTSINHFPINQLLNYNYMMSVLWKTYCVWGGGRDGEHIAVRRRA